MQEDYHTISHYFLFKLCTFHVRLCMCLHSVECVCVFTSVHVYFNSSGGEERMCSLSSCPSLVPLTVIGAILIAARWLVDGSTVMLH